MTQITRLKSNDLKAFVEKVPFGTSRISKALSQTIHHSIQEIHPGAGTTSKALYQVARAIESSYGDTSDISVFERDTQEDIRTEILPTLIEIHELLTWPDNWNGYSALAPKHSAVQYANHWIELFYQEVIE